MDVRSGADAFELILIAHRALSLCIQDTSVIFHREYLQASTEVVVHNEIY